MVPGAAMVVRVRAGETKVVGATAGAQNRRDLGLSWLTIVAIFINDIRFRVFFGEGGANRWASNRVLY